MKKILLSAVALITLAACQTTEIATKPVTEQMAPAPMPKLFTKGEVIRTKVNGADAFTEITNIDGEWQTMKLASGTEVEVKADFIIPPRIIKNMNGRNLKLTVKGGNYKEFWPLKVGNKAAIDYTWAVNGNAGNNTRYCEVLSQENITVVAGNFDTYKVQCYEGQGQWYERRTWYYAPKIESFVKLITEGRNASDIELTSVK
jgi:hypothetical protein